MPCNSGVSLIPEVKGQHEWFAAQGLFNGLVLLGDKTTGSYWDHITGECVYGEPKGVQLEFTDFDLVYTTVSGALKMRPHAHIALSTNLPTKGKFMSLVSRFMHKLMGNRLPPRFLKTMGEEDTRRERMDIGLGLWTPTTQRYYPLEVIKAHPAGLFDTVDGETLFVYYNESAQATDAFYINAHDAQLSGDNILFDTGECLSNGVLYDVDGAEIAVNRPQQMFTRWYGFAYTFPDCDIYDLPVGQQNFVAH